MARRGPANAAAVDRVERVTVPGAARALKVFEIYARERRGMTKSEIARLMGLPESSTSDLLNTLRDLGYVSRTVTSRQFYPTSRLNDLVSDMPVDGLVAFAAEATSLVASQTGETAVFAVLSGSRAEIVAASPGRHRLRYVVTAGDTVSLHATSVGKCILGGLDPQDRAALVETLDLEQLTPHTRTSPSALEADVLRSQGTGLYVAVDEGTIGVSSMAVPGEMGQHVGLGIIAPTARFEHQREELQAGLIQAQSTIFDR